MNHYDPNRQIAIIWSVEDVHEIREDLSDEQAMKVLLEVKRTHDADQGVHWDTLRCWADELFPIVSNVKSTEEMHKGGIYD